MSPIRPHHSEDVPILLSFGLSWTIFSTGTERGGKTGVLLPASLANTKDSGVLSGSGGIGEGGFPLGENKVEKMFYI